MLIPEDGSLPKITRKGFAAFNNIMLIRVPDKLKKPGETTYQLATLDRSKKGERWPADDYVDIMLKMPTLKETNSAEKSSYEEDGVKKTDRKYGKFLPKRFKTKFNYFSNKNHKISSSVPPVTTTDTANFNHFTPYAFQDPQASNGRFHGDNHVQYNERNFNDANTYEYKPNNFSNDNLSYGGHDNILGEGTSTNPLGYSIQSHTANVSRDPAIRNQPYNGDFDFRGNPPVYPGTFVPNPQENNFHRPEISNLNFGQTGRNVNEPFIQNGPNAFGRQRFPPFNSNRAEFVNNNNFEPPNFHHNPMGPALNNNFNAGNNPPLLPAPPLLPFDNFNNGQFQNNFDGRNPHFDQEIWKNHNPPNSHYHRKGNNKRTYKKVWRGRGALNKFSKGNNNRRTANNRYERKEPS